MATLSIEVKFKPGDKVYFLTQWGDLEHCPHCNKAMVVPQRWSSKQVTIRSVSARFMPRGRVEVDYSCGVIMDLANMFATREEATAEVKMRNKALKAKQPS